MAQEWVLAQGINQREPIGITEHAAIRRNMQPDRSIGAHIKIREVSGEVRAVPTKASAAVEAATSRRQPTSTPQQDDITFLAIDVLSRIAEIQRLSFLRGQVDGKRPSRTVARPAGSAGSVRSHLYEFRMGLLAHP